MVRHGASATLDPNAAQAVVESAKAVETSLSKGQVVYGPFDNISPGLGGR